MAKGFDRAEYDRAEDWLVSENASMGDSGRIPREVDHSFGFRSPRAAQAAVAELEAAGFHVTWVGRHWTRPFAVVVNCSRRQKTDRDSVRASTDLLVGIASRHGGTYDGWGSMVVPDDGA